MNGNGGYGYLADKYGIPADSNVKKWIYNYQSYGDEGLHRSKKKQIKEGNWLWDNDWSLWKWNQKYFWTIHLVTDFIFLKFRAIVNYYDCSCFICCENWFSIPLQAELYKCHLSKFLLKFIAILLLLLFFSSS